MKLLFWVSFLALIYTFAGYPLMLFLRSRWKSCPVHKEHAKKSLSVVIAVHNEAALIGRKLENLFSIDWPSDLFQVIVVSDGSTDATNEILSSYSSSHQQLLPIVTERAGKATALNIACKQAEGEILVLADVRQLFEQDAIKEMVSNFADTEVGAVSGSLMLGTFDNSAEVSGEKLKWGIENKIREWEGSNGSVVGALGAFYAIRKNLFTEIPAGLLLDDMWVPLHVVKQHKRVVFEKDAKVWDDLSPTREQEFRRKVRTLTGNYQLLKAAPWLLSPRNPLLLQFVSHKLMRLLAPFALATLLISSIILVEPFYRVALIGQFVFYALAASSSFRLTAGIARLADVAHTFVMLNVAAVLALLNFITGKTDVWVRQ